MCVMHISKWTCTVCRFDFPFLPSPTAYLVIPSTSPLKVITSLSNTKCLTSTVIPYALIMFLISAPIMLRAASIPST